MPHKGKTVTEFHANKHKIETTKLQGDAITSTALIILCSGGKGGGKTAAMILRFLVSVNKGYGSAWSGVIMTCRSTGIENIEKTVFKFCSTFAPEVIYSKKTFQFPTGETLKLQHVHDITEYRSHLLGHSFAFIGMDEAAIWNTDEVFQRAITCLRTAERPQGKLVPCCLFLTTNPVEPGRGSAVNWLYKLMIRGKTPGHTFYIGELPAVYYKSNFQDNTDLVAASPYYSSILSGISDPSLRKSYDDGDWDLQSKCPFAGIWEEKYHVLEPFDIPRHWPVTLSYDGGFSTPFSVGWWATAKDESYVDKKGDTIPIRKNSLIRIQEWYGSAGHNRGLRMLPQDIAMEIRRRDKWDVRYGVADASLFYRHTEICHIDAFTQLGIMFSPSNNAKDSRHAGLETMQNRLNNVKGLREGPGLYIFDTCKDFIEMIGSLPEDPNDPRDVDTKCEDHIYDEARYRVMDTVLDGSISGYFTV